MSKRRNNKMLSNNIKAFLSETSAHGFHYLVNNRNIFERIFWAVIITTGFALAAYINTEALNEARSNPIITTIDTGSVRDVPFPAVTINAGKILNPWGFIEKVLDLLYFECLDVIR